MIFVLLSLGICYELSGNSLYRDMCYQEANKITLTSISKTVITPENLSAAISKKSHIEGLYL